MRSGREAPGCRIGVGAKVGAAAPTPKTFAFAFATAFAPPCAMPAAAVVPVDVMRPAPP
ncbi:hypothetical protein ACFPRL_10575 [Pseudoclavibacter helvolus]